MTSLDGLNPFQKQAAAHLEGPLLIIAGAGAGKTKTITHRILHLIENGIPPDKILAITFTNKAAKEMRERVLALLQQKEGEAALTVPFLSTFHALGVYILRQHGTALGLSRFFSIYDKDDSLAKIKQAMKALDIGEKVYEPRKIMHTISKLKGDGWSLTHFVNEKKPEAYQGMIARIWGKYEDILQAEKALDFDDLLLKTKELFTSRPEILSFYQERWPYINVDEYQDTNAIQYDLTTLLAQKNHNLCVVGDIDQSIYSWRGADYTNILNFEKDYPDATVITLEENYRSTQNILQAANEVIKKNKQRREKNLFTKNKEGEKISLYAALTEQDEAQYIAQTSLELIKQGTPAEEIAVLYRANFQSRVLEEAFLKTGVPYQVLGTRFYERKEIKDILAFIKAALNPNDRESIKRIINIPPRGIGQVTLEKIFNGEIDRLPAKMQDKVKNFQTTLGLIREQAKTARPSELIKFIVEHTGLGNNLKEGGEEEQERLENLKEFASLALKYDQLPPEEGILELITETSLVSDQDSLAVGNQKSGVRLMTVHAAKGLEFANVFISGLEQDLFPHSGLGNEKRDTEEERRLFYVALTRAKEKLFLTYAQSRTIFGSRNTTMPSEFIFDIDESLLAIDTGLHEGDYYKNSGPTSYIDF